MKRIQNQEEKGEFPNGQLYRIAQRIQSSRRLAVTAAACQWGARTIE